MPKLTFKCPSCGKQLKLAREFDLQGVRLFEYTCGHIFSKNYEHVNQDSLLFDAVDGSGKVARDYQKDGVQFIIEHDFNAIIGDQMRLGKTPQALLALRNGEKERTPALILVKSANLWQWVREFKVWCNTLPNGIYPIIGSNAWVPPGFSAYICSMDTFSREKTQEALKRIKFNLIIVDEAHSFKNTESNRSQALVEFVAFQNTGEQYKILDFSCSRCGHKWGEQGKLKFDKRIEHTVISKSVKCPKCSQYCYVSQQYDSKDGWKDNPEARDKVSKLLALAGDVGIPVPEKELALQRAKEIQEKYQIEAKETLRPCGLLLLTGTPILNRADEYFVPLNLINPEKFSSLEQFRRQWLTQDAKGRWSRVKPYYEQQFKNEIKDILLRREKEDVFKELPAINRMFTVIEPDKDTWAKQYNKVLDKLDMILADKANPSYWDMADSLMELRRICGMMKLMWTSDYLESCALESSAKYAIGIHHESVRDLLYIKLGGEQNCYKLSGQDSSEQKDRIMREWEHSPKQFLIINMIAGGVGMDFHYCDNVVVLERQWNIETERQFEFRFYNPDLKIKRNPLSVEYILVKGTIEEWWYNMLEEKRQNVDPLVYNHYDISQDTTSFKELAERTVGSRL